VYTGKNDIVYHMLVSQNRSDDAEHSDYRAT